MRLRKTFATLSAGLLALVLLAGRASALQGETVPLATYWDRIAAARDDVRAARALTGADQRAKLDAAAATLDSMSAVALPDGSVVPVDNADLAHALRATAPDLDALERDLTARREAGRDRTSPSPPAGADDRLRAVLARPEFQYQDESQFQQSLGEFFANLFDRIVRVLLTPAVQYVIIVIGGLLLGGVLLYVLQGMGGAAVTGTALRDLDAVADEDLNAAQAWQRATDLAAGGDYRTAVRYLYLSSLRFLEEAGRLRYDRALTNREYVRQVEGQPDLAEPVRAVVNTFDRTWYGFIPVDAQAYEQFIAQVQALRQVKIA